MKAVVVDRVHHVTIQEHDVPLIKDDEVLIKVKVAGICGSDVHTYKGLHPFRKPPVVMGHEVSGEVTAIGSRVTGFKIGDKITVVPQQGCDSCEYCRNGYENFCKSRRAPGIGEWLGTMAEYFSAPASYVLKLRDDTPHEIGVLIEPLAVGFHAVTKADIQPDDRVAILGAGPIGLLTLAAVRDRGCQSVVVTDVFDYPLEVARQLGASHTVHVRHDADWIETALQKAGGLFDKVIIAAGVSDIVNQALLMAKKGGKIVTVAMFHEQQSVNIANIQHTEKEIIGCMTYIREDFQDAMRLIQRREIPVEKVVSHILPYQQASKGFQMVDRKEDRSLKVLLSF